MERKREWKTDREIKTVSWKTGSNRKVEKEKGKKARKQFFRDMEKSRRNCFEM